MPIVRCRYRALTYRSKKPCSPAPARQEFLISAREKLIPPKNEPSHPERLQETEDGRRKLDTNAKEIRFPRRRGMLRLFSDRKEKGRIMELLELRLRLIRVMWKKYRVLFIDNNVDNVLKARTFQHVEYFERFQKRRWKNNGKMLRLIKIVYRKCRLIFTVDD